ncbi:MAG: tRNA lysidine(34) synthetase TilS [Azonexus sp.]|jgi:tRNA(Ile)-lysidine synthase|uniref:tRNA lysidine(34) synthetase TilS n=1 Tax=Azonexus sp. TaxID=1872668 RepID=UPI00281E6433|nr:tRNA lysidine(34) synthetase TilS [Azonexus sp.]MDR0777626.1 tRNA lysidine(34) synthetase TilS [Azonexus sp.]
MVASRNKLPPDLLARIGAFVAVRLAPDERVCVALSGGCDSVVLAHLLSRLDLSGRLDAIHIHHGLSPNADAWAAFCADYCRDLGIPLQIRHVSVARDAACGLEAAARQARYTAFAEVPAACLALAQHRGDQAETVLLNLLRGAGVLGTAAMPPERQRGHLRLWRPLLGETRDAIEAYARANGLRWITDESNADTRLTRNFIRHRVLPIIEQRFPAAESTLAQAAVHFAEAAELLDELAALDWERAADGETACLAVLRTLSPGRLKNLLRFRLRCLGWRVPVAARLDEFTRQLQSAGPDRHPELHLAEGRMRAARGRLHWLAQP